MIDEFILNLQRLARQTGEQQFRTDALALLRQMVPFESGSWGTAKPDGVGVELTSVQLLDQTEVILHNYQKVRAYDTIGRATIAQPGQAQVLSFRDGYCGAHEAFRAFCEGHQHFNILSAMGNSSIGLRQNFITIARGKASLPFDEADKAHLQKLLPHLLDAWIVNRSWHMRTLPDDSQTRGVVSGICSTVGDLLGDHPDFAQLIASEFPGWAPPRLPPVLMDALEQQGSWRQGRLVIHTYPVADVIFLTARISNEIDKLTAREMTIAKEAAEGFSYKEIARSLGVSPATIRAHLHNIYGKLEINNKTALSRAISFLNTSVPVRPQLDKARYVANPDAMTLLAS